MIIRTATIDDLDIISYVEAKCFPKTEMATKEQFKKRLEYYKDYFWLMFDKNTLISFVDGFCTDEENLTDEMYEKAEMHNDNGKWQMIFGVNTIPEYRRKGYASQLLNYAIQDAKKKNRLGVVLTCKDELINFYSKLGFVNEGKSISEHGGVSWNQMRIRF